MRELAQRITQAHLFEYFIIALIVGNGILLGLETSSSLLERYGTWLSLGQQLTLGVFVVEAALKIFAVSPRVDRYFRDPWNVFDFLIVVLSLVPATGGFAIVARMARLVRVLRLVSVIPELRLIVATLMRSIPGMLHIVTLMGVLTYIYAIIGFQLFHEHDPEHWGNLGISLLSLFRVVTLEDWTDIMYTAMDLHPLSWIYFVSFIVTGTFIVINLFTALVINNLDAAKQERLQVSQRPESREGLLRELRAAQQSLRRLERQLARGQGESGDTS